MSAPQRPPWRPGPTPAGPPPARRFPGAPRNVSRNAPRTLRTLRLVRDVPAADRAPDPTGPLPPWRRRVVALARLLSGGLLALAATVALLPPVLGDGGPGVGVVLAHAAVALVAVVATVVAGQRGIPPAVAVGAGLAVPVLTFVLLAGYWWA